MKFKSIFVEISIEDKTERTIPNPLVPANPNPTLGQVHEREGVPARSRSRDPDKYTQKPTQEALHGRVQSISPVANIISDQTSFPHRPKASKPLWRAIQH